MYAHRRIAILATACLRPLKLPLSLQPGGWAACKPLPTAIQIEGYIRRGGHKERPPPPRRQSTRARLRTLKPGALNLLCHESIKKQLKTVKTSNFLSPVQPKLLDSR